MTDKEILALSRQEASSAIANLSVAEQERISNLYFSTHGTALDGTYAKRAGASSAANVSFEQREQLSNLQSGPNDGSSDDIHANQGNNSKVKVFGIVLFWIGVLIVFIGSIAMLGEEVPNYAAIWAGSGFISWGLLMWFVGILESRLVEIRGELKKLNAGVSPPFAANQSSQRAPT